jgi:hypothetical protein
MSTSTPPDLASIDLTGLLSAWRAGDKMAEQQIFDLLYVQLKSEAQKQLRRLPNAAPLLSPTELTHEAYMR